MNRGKVLIRRRDKTGHTQFLLEPEQADHKADELRDDGYYIFANGRLILSGESIAGFSSVEAVPIPTSG